MKRRHFIALACAGAIWSPLAVRAQQPVMPVVGFLSSGSKSSDALRLTSLWRGLNEAGYEKVGDLPVVQSTKVELILNLKTAKALGIAFPISLLGRADEVIE